MLWLIGVSAADGGQERIPVTIAAATGRHILTLGQGLKAAGHYGRSEVTSLRQYSPADAGVAIATKASALSAAIGAALNFKNCFIFFSLCFLCDGFSPEVEME